MYFGVEVITPGTFKILYNRAKGYYGCAVSQNLQTGIFNSIFGITLGLTVISHSNKTKINKSLFATT